MNPMRKFLRRVLSFWGQSIRAQLAWSFSLVSFVIILMAGFLVVYAQRDFLYKHGTKQALELAETLAANSTSWILINDVNGLQDVLNSAVNTEDLKFAVVLSPKGEVLASTKPEYRGRYFSDAVSTSLYQLPDEPQILLDQPNLIDVTQPIKASKLLIGWVRVELSRDSANKELRGIIAAGSGFAVFFVVDDDLDLHRPGPRTDQGVV